MALGIRLFYFVSLVFVCFSCQKKEGLKFVNPEVKNDSVATRILYNADIILKQSGDLVMKAKAPKIEEYTLVDSAFTLFPKGIKVQYFDNETPKPGSLKADSAIVYEKVGVYEGYGNIEIVTTDGDVLKTSKIFWNKQSGTVTAPDTAYVLQVSGTKILASRGLIASDDFETYTLFQNRGLIFP